MTSSPLFQSTFILRKLSGASFADIIKVVAMFIKVISKDSRKDKKKLEIMYQNAIYKCIS